MKPPLLFYFSLLCGHGLLCLTLLPPHQVNHQEGGAGCIPIIHTFREKSGHDCACCQSELVRVFRISTHCPRPFFFSLPPQHFPLQVCGKNLCFVSICKEAKENQTNSSQQKVPHYELMKGLSNDSCLLQQYRFAQCELSAREHLSPVPEMELSVLSLHLSSYLHMAHVSPTFLLFSTSKDYILLIFLHSFFFSFLNIYTF